MTQSSTPDRAEAKRREKKWSAACRRHEEQLQQLSDRDLDALVAATLFSDPALAGAHFSTSWDGMGRIVEHMRQLGYTMLFSSFEQSHLDWMKQFPSIRDTPPAEVTVVDIRRRMPFPHGWPNLRVGADTLPRAAAIATVLTRLMEHEVAAAPTPQPEAAGPKSGWTEERRQQHSEQMKAYWQRKNAASLEMEPASQP